MESDGARIGRVQATCGRITAFEKLGLLGLKLLVGQDPGVVQLSELLDLGEHVFTVAE
jgi:hypothetical protein